MPLLRRDAPLIAALAGAGALALVLACLLGSTAMGPGQVLAALFGGGDAGDRMIVWEIRLPRALAAFACGAALGLAGAALQGLLRNPLAEPGVLGVSASAALGATLAIAGGLAGAFAFALPVAAVLGALGATALLAALAWRIGSAVTLILVGVGLSSFAGAATALVMNLSPNPFTLADLVNWSLGSVANRSLEDLGFAAPFLIAGAALLALAGPGLSALTLGEETAHALGVDLARIRLLVVGGTGLLVGGAVALAGAVGFVGLVAPHLVRPLVGFDPARTLLPAALLGGLALVLADLATRLAPTSSELKLGVVAALVGAPVFVAIAAQLSGRGVFGGAAANGRRARG